MSRWGTVKDPDQLRLIGRKVRAELLLDYETVNDKPCLCKCTLCSRVWQLQGKGPIDRSQEGHCCNGVLYTRFYRVKRQGDIVSPVAQKHKRAT